VSAQCKEANAGLVVITGGEPLAQGLAGLWPWLSVWRVQVETSGVVDQKLPDWVEVVVSPKTPRINYSGRVTGWKYIIRAGDVSSDDGLPYYTTQRDDADSGRLLTRPPEGGHVWVQPCDEQDPAKNAANLAQCLDSVKRFGYRLSLQTHKIIGWQ
jgi:7-carboxy-7-deazaguanine synthase